MHYLDAASKPCMLYSTLQSPSRKPRRPVLGVLPDVPHQSRPTGLGTAGVSSQKPEPQPDTFYVSYRGGGNVQAMLSRWWVRLTFGEAVAIFEAEYRA